MTHIRLLVKVRWLSNTSVCSTRSPRIVTELNWSRGGSIVVRWLKQSPFFLHSVHSVCCLDNRQFSALRCEYRWWKHSSPSRSVSKREESEVSDVRKQRCPATYAYYRGDPDHVCSLQTFLYPQPTIHTFGSRGRVSTLSGASRWYMRFVSKKRTASSC